MVVAKEHEEEWTLTSLSSGTLTAFMLMSFFRMHSFNSCSQNNNNNENKNDIQYSAVWCMLQRHIVLHKYMPYLGMGRGSPNSQRLGVCCLSLFGCICSQILMRKVLVQGQEGMTYKHRHVSFISVFIAYVICCQSALTWERMAVRVVRDQEWQIVPVGVGCNDMTSLCLSPGRMMTTAEWSTLPSIVICCDECLEWLVVYSTWMWECCLDHIPIIS